LKKNIAISLQGRSFVDHSNPYLDENLCFFQSLFLNYGSSIIGGVGKGMVHSEGKLFPDLGTNYKATPPFDNDPKGKIK
jgi:hypothetical protein